MANVQPNGRPVYRRSDFEQQLIQTRPYLIAFARSLTKSPEYGEELAQDTMMQALAAWKSFAPGSNMRAWTSMILRNRFLTIQRKAWRSVPFDVEMAENTLLDFTDVAADHEVRQTLHDVLYAIATLPEDQRDALIATRILQMQYDEAARRLLCPIGTVKSRVSRGANELLFRVQYKCYLVELPYVLGEGRRVGPHHPYFPIQEANDWIRAHLRRRFKRHIPKPKKKRRRRKKVKKTAGA